MEIALKQRIVGALIVIGAAVVFIPSLLDGPVIDTRELALDVPPHPEFEPYHVDSARYEALVTEVEEQIKIDQDQTTALDADRDHEPKTTPVPTPVPVVESPKPSLKPVWTVQLGSFTQIKNAQELEAKLQKNKFTAYMQKTHTDNGIRYRVYVGPEIRQEDANEALKQLQKKFGLSGLVVKYEMGS